MELFTGGYKKAKPVLTSFAELSWVSIHKLTYDRYSVPFHGHKP